MIRPLRPEDAAAAERAFWAGIQTQIPVEHRPADHDLATARGTARMAHLIATDPGGAWGAEVGGELVGVAVSLIREDVWGLSAFGVHPDHHGGGIGRALLAEAVAYGAACRGGLILSSQHPAALRSYFRAGFAPLPCLSLAGAVNATRVADGLRSRPGHPQLDRDLLEACSRHVRGASHLRDVPPALAGGFGLLVYEDRGFALHREGSVGLLAALDEEAARDLLWSSLAAGGPGASVQLDFLTGANAWAMDVGLQAGLTLSTDGPFFVRGEVGPLAPYIPSGAYL